MARLAAKALNVHRWALPYHRAFACTGDNYLFRCLQAEISVDTRVPPLTHTKPLAPNADAELPSSPAGTALPYTGRYIACRGLSERTNDRDAFTARRLPPSLGNGVE